MSGSGHERLLRGEVFSPDSAPVTANRHVLSGDHAPHDHDFVEVAVMLGGRGTHRTIYGDQPVTSGDAFVLKPGVWHGYRDCRRLEVYNCCFGPELLGRELAWVAEDSALSSLLQDSPGPRQERGISRLRLPRASLESCRLHLDGLNQGASSDPARARLDGVGRLLLFLGALAPGLEAGSGPGGRPAPRVHRFVKEGVRRLEADPARRWSLEELCGELSVNGSYLARLFKSGTGLPPIAYLNRYRAELSANLLLRTDLPVSRVGERVGWHDPNYFARRFRAHFGVSATAYRGRMGSMRPGSTGGS